MSLPISDVHQSVQLFKTENIAIIMSFSNKVVIITGASSGIGAATALHFAKEGANVVVVGRNETRLKEINEKISKIGKKPLILNADVGKNDDAKRIIQETIQKYGQIDILINNAGITGYANVDEEKIIDIFDSIMNTNLRGVVLLTSLASPYLKKTKGNIVNVSSVAAVSTMGRYRFGAASYCTSKAALNQFSRNCALELAQSGIRVNIVSPGPVPTNFRQAAGIVNPDYEATGKQITALQKLIQPEEVADVIVYLASDKAKSITGSDYVIDAGTLVK